MDSGPLMRHETAVAPMPPKIICPSIPKFQKRTRNAADPANPTRISGAPWNRTDFKFEESNKVATTSSFMRFAAGTPARTRTAPERTRPKAIDPMSMP